MDEEATTYVFDATDMVIGRLASHVAKILLNGQKDGTLDRVIITNAESAVVSGSKKAVFATYRKKYELNHARKGPFFPRMPDKILKRTVRGMLPYQKKSSGRAALRLVLQEHPDSRIPCSAQLACGNWLPEPSCDRGTPRRS